MSNNIDTIQILKQQAEEAQKGIRVLEAVKGVKDFLVVTVDNGNITVTPSEGLDLTSAIGALAAAIRSFSGKLNSSESIGQLLNIVEGELNSVYDRAEQLKADEEADAAAQAIADEASQEAIDGEYSEPHPMDAPETPKKATRTRARK